MKNNMTAKLFEALHEANEDSFGKNKKSILEMTTSEVIEEDVTTEEKSYKMCPRCGRPYSDYPAISRYDNKTEICPDCGVEEAMINYTGGTLEAPNKFEKEARKYNKENRIKESVDNDLVTIHFGINTDADEERYKEEGNHDFMPISYVTDNFKKDIEKLLGHSNFKLECVSEKGPHGWPVYFITGNIEDMKKVCEYFSGDDFESTLVDDSVREFYNKNKGKNLSPKFVSSDEINEEVTIDTPTQEDLDKDEADIKALDKKQIEDRIGELRLAIEDEALSDDEKESAKKELDELENELLKKESENADKDSKKKQLKEDSYEEPFFAEIEDALTNAGFDVTRYSDAGMLTSNLGWIVSNSEGEVNLTCAGTYLTESDDEEKDSDETCEDKKEISNAKSFDEVIDLLVSDEEEAIDGYTEAIEKLKELDEEEKEKLIDMLSHIRDEEEEHIDELENKEIEEEE